MVYGGSRSLQLDSDGILPPPEAFLLRRSRLSPIAADDHTHDRAAANSALTLCACGEPPRVADVVSPVRAEMFDEAIIAGSHPAGGVDVSERLFDIRLVGLVAMFFGRTT
jgi:hypothetical protein